MQKYSVLIVLGYVCCLAESFELNVTRYRRQSSGKGCTLPQHPDHGQWKLLNGEGKPGGKVPSSSVIKFECNSGYKLSENVYLICEEDWNSHKMPECEELCPPLYSSTTFDLKCTDKRGTGIKCSEATHGTYVEYTCAPFYETPFGYKKTLLCSNGKWSQRPVCQPVCGKKIAIEGRPTIYGSKPNEILEYPWITTLYRKRNDSFEYICGGSILSLTVVLTAAHCVTNNYGDPLPKENYMIGAGKLYREYQAPQDENAQYLELSKIIVHKDYRADHRRFLADIAVLVLKNELTLNKTIQPVCFNNLNTIHLHPGNVGEVSGWGKTENNTLSEKLRTLKIPYKYETTCAEELPSDWANQFNSIDKICAGFVNKSMSVCDGDSGNGFVFINPEDNRYYIHGIVSIGPANEGGCNVQQNSLYTKVAFYYEYIDRLLTIYAPEVKDCLLPPHPKNGKWMTDKQDKKPGDAVSSSTILRLECNTRFKLSSVVTNINCGLSHNMPSCQALCPPLVFPNGTDYRCFNEAGQTVDCSEAVDNTKLVYSCPKGYNIANGTNTRFCEQGSWGSYQPQCVRPVKNCGKKNKVVNGSETALEYPWNVFLYLKTPEKMEYICGATILSAKVVLTTAVCVTEISSNKHPEENYLLATGKRFANYIHSEDQSNAQFSNVSRILIHHSYRGSERRYSADIAIIIPETPFTFNNYVQPICFSGIRDIQLNPGDMGVVLKYKDSDEQKILHVSYKDQNKCENEFSKRFADNYKLIDKLCAGVDNTSEVLCSGDSGKGYAVRNPEDDRYYIHGLVSVTDIIQRFPEKICHYNALYTSVPFYYDFINNALIQFA